MYWKSIARSWRHHFTLQLATLTVMSASLFTVVVFTSIYVNLESILTLWGKNLQMTVYLQPNLSGEDLQVIEQFIKTEEKIHSSEYVEVDEAIRRFQSQMGAYAPDLFSDEELKGLVPPSFEIRLSEATMMGSPIKFMRDFATQVAELYGVEDVTYGQEWVRRYNSMIQVMIYFGAFLITMLIIGCLFVTGNSVRVALNQRREEIEILELIGATKKMIRRPFIFEGAVTGLAASAMALFGSLSLYWFLTNSFRSQIAFIGLKGHLSFLPWYFIAGFLVLGLCIGAIGAWLCMASLNDGWAARQRAQL